MAFIFMCSTSYDAQAGIIEFFFPSLKKEQYDPSKTLQAPFAYEGEKQQEGIVAKKEEENTKTSLEKPHRLRHEIGEWLTRTVSEVLTFETSDYNGDYRTPPLA